MTYKEAREYLIPIAANCVLPQYAAALEKAMEALELAESVVRCKECKWHEEIHGWYRCLWWHNVTEPGVFCSMGERREEG